MARFVQIGVLADRLSGIVRLVAQPSLVQLVLRLGLAMPFWRSGVLKWDGFLQLNDTAVDTVQQRVHAASARRPLSVSRRPRCSPSCPDVRKFCLPVLLVFGFATRFAATGLLFMTCIVELTVPDGWPIHITWAAMALGIMAWGPGSLSLDYAIRRPLGLPTSVR